MWDFCWNLCRISAGFAILLGRHISLTPHLGEMYVSIKGLMFWITYIRNTSGMVLWWFTWYNGHLVSIILSITVFKQYSSQRYALIYICHDTYSRFVNVVCTLTHWGRDKMVVILQTTFSNAFSILINILPELIRKGSVSTGALKPEEQKYI